MKIVQAVKQSNTSWRYLSTKQALQNPLVFVFASRFLLEKPSVVEDVKSEFPYSHIVFGSTSGEIMGQNVYDDTLVVTAIEFEKSSFVIKTANILDFNRNSKELGYALAEKIPSENLSHVFVLSEGSFVNGSALIEGIEAVLGINVSLTGGMCGDGPRFIKTLTSYNEAPKEGEVVLIGLYGKTLEVSFASFGGWTPFGPERVITKSKDNVLYELDNQLALDLYSKYLGEKAAQLPQASLLYPLNVTPEGKTKPVVRTILSIDDKEKSMVLAGDIPENAKAQLMMASVDSIAGGAHEAARLAMENRKNRPELALLVSCVGRKLVMDQRVEEEIEHVMEVVGDDVKIAGFYSYGEIAPFNGERFSELHNQTMTLTLISE